MSGESWLNGEYLNIKMDVERSYSGVRVPSSAISNNQMYVYSKADSMLTSKDIIILNENASGSFVSGLSDNDIVVVQEVINYQDSAKYSVIIK